MTHYRIYNTVIKRCFDCLAALAALIVLSPLLLGLVLASWLTGHRRVFFTQQRIGYRERPFRLFKFRSMTELTDARGVLRPDAERLTSYGRLLRSSSLDELPQLFNVLRGDMSLVGPRPLLPEYLPLYHERQRRRHEVRPGISGWAQVNGRNAISWTRKFEWDIAYVEQQSFLLDLKIIALTVKKIFIREGISQAGQATVEPFNGTN